METSQGFAGGIGPPDPFLTEDNSASWLDPERTFFGARPGCQTGLPRWLCHHVSTV